MFLFVYPKLRVYISKCYGLNGVDRPTHNINSLVHAKCAELVTRYIPTFPSSKDKAWQGCCCYEASPNQLNLDLGRCDYVVLPRHVSSSVSWL